MTTLADNGKDIRPFANGLTVRACDLATVKAEFDRQYVADGTTRQKADTRRKAFQRAVSDAQGRGVIASREIDGTQLVWLVNPKGDKP